MGIGERSWPAFMREAVYSDFVQKVAETIATRIALIGITLLTSVLVTRILGPEGRGLYAVAAAVGAIGVQFGNLGLHASNTYSVAKDRSLLPALLGNTLLVSFVFGSLGGIAAWAVFSTWPQWAPVQGWLLALALLWVPFGLAYLLIQNLLLGIQEVRAYNKIEVSTNILVVVFVGLVIAYGTVTVETVFSAGLAALAIAFLWALWRLRSFLPVFPLPSLRLFYGNLHYGLKAYLAAFFAFLVLRLDLLMVKYILGSEDSGYYSIAVVMADMIYLLPVVIGTILFPKLSAMSSHREKWKYAKTVAMGVGFILLLLTGLAGLMAEPAVRLLYGEAFLPAVPAFLWLLPGIVLLSINVIYMNYFASTGMPLVTVYSPGAAAALNMMLNLKLIPALGIVGASISSTLCYGMMLMLSMIHVFRTREYPREYQ